jgi:antitoxin CptB
MPSADNPKNYAAMPTIPSPINTHAQLKWRCRRGMLELDLLLQGFLEHRYHTLTAHGREAFQELLSYPDQDLLEYLMARALPTDKDVADVVNCIRNTTFP